MQAEGRSATKRTYFTALRNPTSYADRLVGLERRLPLARAKTIWPERICSRIDGVDHGSKSAGTRPGGIVDECGPTELRVVKAAAIFAMALAMVSAGCAHGIPATALSESRPRFAVAAEPASVAVSQGAEALVRVAVTRDAGFTDPVTVSGTAGVQGIDAATVLVSNEMAYGWLRISVSPEVPAGTVANVTVNGVGANATAVAQLPLTVTPTDAPSQEKIRAAVANGSLDAATALLYRAYASFGDPALPALYAGSGSEPEDNFLLDEIRARWAGLTPDLQAKLLPFTLEPSDPQSWYQEAAPPSPKPAMAAQPRPLKTGASEPDPFPPASCEETRFPLPYRLASKRSATNPVRVWVDCTGDRILDIQGIYMLNETLTVIDKIWQPMTQLMGPPILDKKTGDPTINFFLERGPGKWEPGKKGALGQTTAIGPADGAGMSAYVVIPEWTFGTSRFRTTVIHELFHVLQYAHLHLVDVVSPIRKVYWFYEASACWAAAHFDRVLEWDNDGRGAYDDVHIRFAREFQTSDLGLNDLNDEPHAYAAYIWPYFVEQNTGGPVFMGKIWAGLGGATGFVQADDIVDAAYPFADHFRDFALRNVNTELLPGDPLPISTRYINLDPEFRDDKKEPRYDGRDISEEIAGQVFTIDLQPLSARYLKFSVTSDQLKQIVFDTSGVTLFRGLDVDALVKIDGKWEAAPRHLDPFADAILKFCLARPAEKLQEIRFIVSNHLRGYDQKFDVPIKLTASNSACDGIWKGTSSITTVNTTVSANVTWVFDAAHSVPGTARFTARGTATLSETKPGCTITYDPATGPIVDDGFSALVVQRNPTTDEFDVTGIGITTWTATRTETCTGLPTNASTGQHGGSWFNPALITPPLKLDAEGTKIEGAAVTPYLETFSFTYQ
jgi:hypothetical protein